MTRSPLRLLPLAVALMACSAGKANEDGDDQWWVIDGDGGSGEGDGDEDDEDDEDDEEEDGAIFWGEVFGEPGSWEQGEAGVEVFSEGEDLCILWFQLEDIADTDGCDACEVAVTMTIADLELDVDEACEEFGIDADALDGQQIGIGWNGDSVYYADGGGDFEEAGEGWQDEGEYGWEIWLDE